MYRKTRNDWLKYINFLILDIFCLEVTFFLAWFVRQNGRISWGISEYMQLAVVMVLIDLWVEFFREGYRGILQRGHWKEFKDTSLHVSIVVLLTIGYMFTMQKAAIYSRWVLLITLGLGILVSYMGRTLLKLFVRRWLEKHETGRAVIVLTSKELAEITLESLHNKKYRDYCVIGFIILDQDMQGQSIGEVPVVASAENALDYMKEEVVDEAFFNLPGAFEPPKEIMDGCLAMGIITHLSLLQISTLQWNKTVEKFGEYMVVTTSMNSVTRRQLFVKRGMDITGGIIGVLLTLLLVIFVAPIIYIQSPGPILFTQTRIGKNGREFKIYKFRSMYLDAETRKKDLMDQNEMKGYIFKVKNDPRIFPFGRFMRRSSIDEFPQFFNVLKGEMSLVGTRPPTKDEYHNYEFWHKKRLAIKPGLTGLWQVSGRNRVTDFDEIVRLDTKYISDWNLGLDIKILLKTVAVVLRQRGAE